MRINKILQQTEIIIFLFFLSITTVSFSQTKNAAFETVQTYEIQEARQGVAVDSAYFFAINTKGIGKYRKKNGELVAEWKDDSGQIIHFDGGVVVNGKLYCAHSNYPEIPMTSSIEIFDTENLEHLGSHSFGVKYGSCTWADYYNDYWWVCFAHYDKFEPLTNKNNRWTVLVMFDKNWHEMESWTFPVPVLQEFKPMSCSGGSWGPDGNLYVTGHDSAKVYVLQLPEMGSTLALKNILKITSEGQGIAWDRYEKNNLYGIVKKNNSVVKSRLLSP